MKFRFPTFAETLRAGFGTFRLLRGDWNTTRYFGSTAQAALSSFSVYLFSIPLVTLVAWPQIVATTQTFEITPLQSAVYFVLRIIVGLFFGLAITERLSRRLRCNEHFFHYVCVSNWVDLFITPVLLLLIPLLSGYTDPTYVGVVIRTAITVISLVIVMSTFRLGVFPAAAIVLVTFVGEEIVRYLMDFSLIVHLVTPEMLEQARTT